MKPVTLIAKHGDLYTARSDMAPGDQKYFRSDPPLLVYKGVGGGNGIDWPSLNENDLRRALGHARDAGRIPNIATVILPDGKEFAI